ncbi:MAG: PLP-dependent aminotransferase family protein [Anaerolineales bacterium]|nr:PLP-dependent aminotransferase family protein [Anaerolineales bacterium]
MTQETTQANVAADVINFGIGQPNFDILPTELIHKAAEHRLSQRDPRYLNYGFEQGDGYLREAMAAFLTPAYGFPVQASQLLLSVGATQAIDMICSAFTQPGDVIFVEEPTFFLILGLFRDHGLQIVPIPLDDEGLDLAVLEEKLAQYQPKLLYTIPTFQNPTSRNLSLERRQKLVALSQKHNFLIVADEVYQLLHYTKTPPPSFATFLDSEQVFSIGSFSKILAPGLRLGWIHTSPKLMKQLLNKGLMASGGGLNHFTSGIVRSVVEQGWQADYLAGLKQIYERRIAILADALEQFLPKNILFQKPGGGYFFWLKLPEEMDGTRLLQTAVSHKVGFQPGIRFSSRNTLNNFIRLSFAFYEEAELVEGAKRLAAALDEYTQL